MSIVSLFKNKSDASDRFERLIRPKIEALYRMSYRFCNSQDEAEELVQQLLIRIFPKIDQMEKIEHLNAWLASSLFNLYIDIYRKTTRDELIISSGDEYECMPNSEQSPFEHVSSHQVRQSIEAALLRLNDNQRIAILLHDAEGYTMEELAVIFQVPLGTIKSRLNRARSLLKKLIPIESADENDRIQPGVRYVS